MARSAIKRELIKKSRVMIADNMLVSVIRTSRSTVVKNNLDFSAAICNSAGELIAHLGIPDSSYKTWSIGRLSLMGKARKS